MTGYKDLMKKIALELPELERQLVAGVEYLDDYLNEIGELIKSDAIFGNANLTPKQMNEKLVRFTELMVITKDLRASIKESLKLMKEFRSKMPGTSHHYNYGLEAACKGFMFAMGNQVQRIADHKEKYLDVLDQFASYEAFTGKIIDENETKTRTANINKVVNRLLKKDSLEQKVNKNAVDDENFYS